MKSKKQIGPDFWQYARNFLHFHLPKVRNLSQNTIGSYKQSISYYIDYLEAQIGIERQDITFDHLTRKYVKNYLVWMNEVKNLADKTCNLRLTALKSFMEYCADEDITLVAIYNDVRSVRGLKEHKKTVLYMTNEAIETLLKTPRTDTKKGKRNRMMFIMLYDTAARAQELADITLRDLHIVNVKIPFITLTGKGNKSRNVPLMEKTVAHINRYLQEFHPHPRKDGGDPLFYSMRDGKPHALSTDSINLLLGQYANQARLSCSEIPEHVHCHLIRKTRAMTLYRQGMPLTVIMEMLGHESLSTTSNFYAFATLDMIHEAMKKTSPEAVEEAPLWKGKDFTKLLYSLD
ncbi:tyrosine-type recombinase/integrase [Anaerosolibacter sp.]|uniref:tyrosine-type recombinase/integrase n=1 Tax=Anaerosolibacter sp. TaxID=1872527 RepID=UPI0039F03E29